MATQLKKFTPLLLPLLFVFISLFVYRYERYGIEGALYTDHKVFMAVREVVSGDLEFLGRVVSFDRVREKASNFLFRPGLGLYLGTMDIFFRDHFSIWGLGSLLLNGLCGWLVYLLLRRISSPRIAAILAILFTVHYSGSPIVVWRHISAYILGLSFFILGLIEIARPARPRLALLFLWFFLSTFFHENTAFALLPLVVFLFATQKYLKLRWEWSKGNAIQGRELATLASVSVAYFLISLIDLFVRNPPGGAFANHPLFERSLLGIIVYLTKVVVNTVLVAGSFPAAYFIPQSNQLDWAGQKMVYAICGIGLLIFLFQAFFKKLRSHEVPLTLSPLWFAGAYVFSLSLCLGAVRLVHNGYYYLSHSRYYQYFGNLLWTLAFAVVLEKVLRSHPRKWVSLIFALVLLNQIFFSVARHQRIGLITHASEKEQAETIWRVSQLIGDDECLLAPGTPDWESKVPFVFLYRKSCAVRKNGTGITTDTLSQRLK